MNAFDDFHSRLKSACRFFLGLVFLVLLAACDAYTWGSNSFGQLGRGTVGVDLPIPGVSQPGWTWLYLDASWNHTCGVRDDETLWCWGRNNRGQIGDGTIGTDRSSPVQVGTASDWMSVAPGRDHTCGIRAGGQLWCWGRGTEGALGNGVLANSLVPVRVGTQADWKEVAAGTRPFTCGIRGAGQLYCWGENTAGQLGVGDLVHRASPTLVAGTPWSGLDLGARTSCALRDGDKPYCWGDNSDQQIDLTPVSYTTPTPLWAVLKAIGVLDAQDAVINVVAGASSICATDYDVRFTSAIGSTHCMGDAVVAGNLNTSGGGIVPGLPVGCEGQTNFCENVPRFFQDISLSSDFACGIDFFDKHAYCWGSGDRGQMGDGFSTDNQLPNRVLGEARWYSVSAAGNHTVGLLMPDLSQ